jgi:hypothetical protein
VYGKYEIGVGMAKGAGLKVILSIDGRSRMKRYPVA